MLLRFGVENHKSISSYQELLMTASSLKDTEEGLITVGAPSESRRFEHSTKRLRVVPVAAIYGANAAGKSTVLKAFDFFVSGIVYSHTRVASSKGTPYAPFLLDDDSRNKPSRYDVDVAIDNTRFHYGYSLDGKKIVAEWLYSYDLESARQVKRLLFLRGASEDGSSVEFQFGKSLRGENRQIAKLVRANSLFLSVAAQNAHPQLTPLFEFFRAQITRRIDESESPQSVAEQLFAYLGTDQKRKEETVKFLRAADIGIYGIDFSRRPVDEKAKQIIQEFEELLSRHFSEKNLPLLKSDDEKVDAALTHVGKNAKPYPIELDDESAGTFSLLRLMGPVFRRLHEGGVLIVDELNSTLHPLISRELIGLFSSPISNPGKAQLIFTTHDTNLLSVGFLRRDQVWFAEKDAEGATHVYALSDIKVRSDDNFERGYLTGRFGAIPFIGCDVANILVPAKEDASSRK